MSKKKSEQKPTKKAEKPAPELTTDEAAEKLFPQRVIDAARRQVFESDSRKLRTDKE